MKRVKRYPKSGDKRVKFKFLLFPKKLNIEGYCAGTGHLMETRWLCRAGIVQRCAMKSRSGGRVWLDESFLNEDRLNEFINSRNTLPEKQSGNKPVYEPDEQGDN